MKNTNAQKIEFIKEIVKINATQSFSGTSSGVVALAAAKASSLLKSKIFYTTCFVSPYIYLNSAHIGIPKLGRSGLRKTLAAGLVLKNPSKGLHLMHDLTSANIKQINKMAENPTLINVELQYKTKPIYCRVIAVDDKSNVADVTISDEPNMFTSVKFNNKETISISRRKERLQSAGFTSFEEVTDYILCKDAYELCKEVKIEELSFLDEHIKVNQKICNEGIMNLPKDSIYRHFEDAMVILSTPEHGFSTKYWTYRLFRQILAGIDARMCGFPLPAMTSATNGDHGIVAVMMPYIHGREFDIPNEKIYQSILLSHFITWKISIKIGKLAGMCGTAVAAVAGALAAIAFQNDWEWDKVKNLLNMHIAQQAGSICYGSSPICAFKVFSAMASGLFSYELCANGGFIPHRDGVVHQLFQTTLNNMNKYAQATNDEIVNAITSQYQKKLNKKGK